jgi:hypothetical protein
MGRSAIERLVFHAALLGGEGGAAREIAHFVAAAAQGGNGRSCLDAGVPLEIFLEAPGPPSFGFAVRLGDARAPSFEAMEGLVADDDARALAEAMGAMGWEGEGSTFGVWLARDRRGSTLIADVRAASGEVALNHVRRRLSLSACTRLDRYEAALPGASPWGLSMTARDGSVRSIEMRWLLDRRSDPARSARAVGPEAAWKSMARVLEEVLGGPMSERAHPWLAATRLDEEEPPRMATSAWSRRLDLDPKRARLVEVFESLHGPAKQADATWRLLRNAVPEGQRWVIGRGLEASVDDRGEVSLRAVLVPSPTAPLLAKPQEDA